MMKPPTYGIVSGNVQIVPENAGIYYRAENEKYLLFFENSNVKKIFRNIDENYEKMLFKIYQVKVAKEGFIKSEKFYYYWKGRLFEKERILDLVESDFTILEIDGKSYFFPSDGEKDRLERFLEEHSENEIIIKKYKEGVLSGGELPETKKTIEVLEEETGIKNEKKSRWDQICDFFKGIGNWFVKIWNTITGWLKRF